MAPSRSRSSDTSSSSSSASSSSTSKGTTDASHSSRTIGYAVGFGVGIPILLTICILIWVTIRHRRKQREEDEIDKDIDFNGDVSFWSPRMPGHEGQFGVFNGEPNAGAHRRDTMTTSHTGLNGDSESLANLSELDTHSNKDFANASLSHLYTPELGFTPQGSQENFSRAIHSVYGPSPAYPSTYKLQAPSVHGSSTSGRFGHYSSGSFSSSTQGVGPFATPPRNAGTPSTVSEQVFPPAPSFGNSTHPYADHYRRNSDSSVASRRYSSVDDLDAAKQGGRVTTAVVNDPSSGPTTADDESERLPPPESTQLKGLRESPHPYSNLVGALSAQSIHTASAELMEPANNGGAEYENEEDITDPSSPLRGELKNPTRHIYHQQARDRTSTFAFQQ